MDHFILRAPLSRTFIHQLFKAFFFCAFIFNLSYANEEFSLELKQGDLINFFANKKNIYEKDKQKIVQAEGNIVIVHQNSTIYGDECLMNFTTGQLELHGNVRLIGQDLTLYGTDIYYNSNTKNFTIENAKLFTIKYSVVAKKIHRLDPAHYVADDAEFTTCLDCPESWSVFATKFLITIDEYVTAKNAMLKIKGADSFYLPYIKFPIKRGRETGLLFPKIKIRFDQGFSYEQPFFWNISPYQDMTLSPAFWTKRGYSNKLEYRWKYDYNSWIKFDNTYMNDKIYYPNKENDDSTGQKYFRYYHLADFGYRPNNNFGFQFFYNDFRDLDMYRDFNKDLSSKLYSAETGIDSFAFWRLNRAELNVQTLVPNSLLRSNERVEENIFQRDDKAVATLPKVSLDLPTTQIKWSNNSFFPSATGKVDMETTTFTQNKLSPGGKYRNAQRTIISPQVSFPWWNGEVLQLETTFNQDYMHYDFREDGSQNFNKMQLKGVTSLSFEFGKIFGVSTTSKDLEVPEKHNQLEEKNPRKEAMLEGDAQLITPLPSWQKKINDENKPLPVPSYRHISSIALNHYYLFEEQLRGNNDFKYQIQEYNGWFDYRDALLDYDYTVASEEFLTTIPTVNTMEFAWNNQLIRKSPKAVDFSRDYYYNPDQFSFGKVLYLNFSQGVRLKERRENSDFKSSLTRLMTQVGSSLNPYFTFGMTDYFFHQNSKHIVGLEIGNNFELVTLTHEFEYNEFDARKNYRFNAEYRLNDPLTLTFSNLHDLTLNRSLTQNYGMKYKSPSKCWFVSLAYQEALNDKSISFDFAFYFGDQAAI